MTSTASLSTLNSLSTTVVENLGGDQGCTGDRSLVEGLHRGNRVQYCCTATREGSTHSFMSVFGRRSLVPRRVLFSERRTYATATQIPRPPPPTEEPPTETFSAPSKPKLYYTRPPPRDELPQIQVPSICWYAMKI